MQYLEKMKELLEKLEHFEVNLVSRAQNSPADALAKLASSSFNDLERTVMVEILKQKSIDEALVEVNCIDNDRQWYDDLLAYKLYVLPIDKIEARRFRRDSIWFLMYQGAMYKRGFSLSLQRCIKTFEFAKLIEEIHEGSYGNHIGERALSLEAMKRE
ncbi:uncharacterized protein LOC110685793 [Chenopodium quinoa]|uniref:uncharacterized protein LOC110685793 n=1 Tax=Chenopodium quinoa TaxID=63459 RepID=UPI000B795219|nr:uncharacterized protein LOC110685793 [Chenopodium quinoa]